MKESFQCFYKRIISVQLILFDSVYKEDEKYYRKVFLEQCFVFVFWKIRTNKIKFINLFKKKQAN